MEKQNIIEALVGPVEKLMDIVQSALGTAFKPKLIVKTAEAEAKAIEMKTDVKAKEMDTMIDIIKKHPNLKIHYSSENIEIDTPDIEFMERTQKRVCYQELNKQKNIENIIACAYSDIEHDTEVSSEPVDKDWISRFFNSVEDISEESMQKLWGKILADEIRKPKSYSLRTLEILHNISKDEAILFQKYCKFVFNIDGVLGIPNYKILNNILDIRFSDLLLLDECGLINNNEIALNMTMYKTPKMLLYNEKYVVLASNPNSWKPVITIKHSSLTRAGEEIYGLFKEANTNDFLMSFASEIEKDNKDVLISVYKIKDKNNNIIDYFLERDYLHMGPTDIMTPWGDIYST